MKCTTCEMSIYRVVYGTQDFLIFACIAILCGKVYYDLTICENHCSCNNE